ICAFTQTTTANSWGLPTTGQVKYRFSPDNATTWYYHNGTDWVSLVGDPAFSDATTNDWYLFTSDPAVRRGRWNNFPNNLLPPSPLPGNFRWKAYLVSSGIQGVALDKVDITDVYLEVKQPNNTSHKLTPGGVYDIKWDYSNAGSTVYLEYCTDYNPGTGAGTWQAVTTTWQAIGPKQFTWNPVPEANSETCGLKITTDTGIIDRSDGCYWIKPEVAGWVDSVVSPEAKTYLPLQTLPVSWSHTGTTGNVKIEYQEFYGGGWVKRYDIATRPLVDDYYGGFSLPNNITITNKARVKVYVVGDEPNAKYSPEFKVQQLIVVTGKFNGTESPNSFEVGTNAYDITWSVYGKDPDEVDVGCAVTVTYGAGEPYDQNFIATVATPTASVPGWSIPYDVGVKKVKVKKRWPRSWESAVEDISDTNFTIRGKIESVGKPILNQVWLVDMTEPVTWTIKGTYGAPNIDVYKIEVSTEGVNGPYYLLGTNTKGVNMGSYISETRTVPITASSTGYIRVSDITNPSEVSCTSSSFIIRNRFILMRPNSTDDAPMIFTVNDSPPTSIPIRWKNKGIIPAVKIEYSRSGNFSGDEQTLYTVDPNNGHDAENAWSWQIPLDWLTMPNQTAKIRVSQTTDANVNAISEPFKIKGQIDVDYPDGGETWLVKEKQVITYTIKGKIPKVDIYWDSVNPANLIANDLPNQTGQCSWSAGGTWEVPDKVGIHKILVIDNDDSTVQALSGNDFSVKGKLEIVSPIASTIWSVGDTNRPIVFKVWGSVGWVYLDYRNAAGNWIEFASRDCSANGVGPQEYSDVVWAVVQDVITSTARIRLRCATETPANSVLSQLFTINSKIQVGKPVFGDPYFVYNDPTQTTKYPITWTYTGSVNNVAIEYKVGAGSWLPLTTTSAGVLGDGSFSWAVTDTISSNVKVRVLDNDPGHPTSNSPESAQFAIKGFLKMVTPSPAGGEVWVAEDPSKEIKWAAVGTPSAGLFDKVKIEFSANASEGLPTWNDITTTDITNISSTNNTLPWWPSVADVSSDDCKIRLSGIDA
ncbi:MAG: hypothetical protein QME51_07105, partial [Planctomycetota bacterium]|nr:hypothetical protein [Planctomycetota bacterium]